MALSKMCIRDREYPICMRGISHSLCVYYGYIAGKNCVAGV